MWSSAVLLGIGLVTVISYQIGKIKGWDEWDEAYKKGMKEDV
jgi:hypothetical protein